MKSSLYFAKELVFHLKDSKEPLERHGRDIIIFNLFLERWLWILDWSWEWVDTRKSGGLVKGVKQEMMMLNSDREGLGLGLKQW